MSLFVTDNDSDSQVVAVLEQFEATQADENRVTHYRMATSAPRPNEHDFSGCVFNGPVTINFGKPN